MTREQIHIGDMSHETAIGILKLMLEAMETYDGISPTPERINAVKMAIESLTMSSVTPQEPQTFKWCETCKEYDQEKHCCHRWSKAIRNTVEEMKQEYIERDVLDKIRAEIEQKLGTHGNISLYNRAIYDVLMILDKYKAESESI